MTAPPVLLLHGLGRSGWAMRPLARRLRNDEFSPVVIGYRSRLQDYAAVERQVRAAARGLGERPVHLVGHSLGGLLALALTAGLAPSSIGRIVLLGSPIGGSLVAQRIAALGPLRVALGRHAERLIRGVSLPPDVKVGMIAGDRPSLPAWGWLHDGPHDGTVALAETWADGLSDHLVLPVGHTGLLLDHEVARQISAFLRVGRFDRQRRVKV